MLYDDIENMIFEKGKSWSDVNGVEINDTPLSFNQFKKIASEITIYTENLSLVCIIGTGWWIFGRREWDSYYDEVEDFVTLSYEECPKAREPVIVNVEEFVKKLYSDE